MSKTYKLKGRVYRVVVRPALLYGTECWPIKRSHIQRMMVAEMKMIRWICGHTRLDKIRNEVIRGKIGVVSMENKIRHARLRWFDHIRRMDIDVPVRRCENINRPDYRRSRGKPKRVGAKLLDMI